MVDLDGVEFVQGSVGDDSLTIITNDIHSVSGGSGFDDISLIDASGNVVDLDGVEFVQGSAGDDSLTIITNDIHSVSGGSGFDDISLIDALGNSVDLMVLSLFKVVLVMTVSTVTDIHSVSVTLDGCDGADMRQVMWLTAGVEFGSKVVLVMTVFDGGYE